MGRHSLLRDPALDGEHRGHVAYDAQNAGHLIMPDGSLISSTDHTFMTACAPHVLAAHMAARAESEAA